VIVAAALALAVHSAAQALDAEISALAKTAPDVTGAGLLVSLARGAIVDARVPQVSGKTLARQEQRDGTSTRKAIALSRVVLKHVWPVECRRHS
jgi:hypothetical protein